MTNERRFDPCYVVIRNSANSRQRTNLEDKVEATPDRRTVIKTLVASGIFATFALRPKRGAAKNDNNPPVFRNGRNQLILFTPLKRAPSTLIATGNGVTNLGRFLGKVVLVNFWATWCPVCRREMPLLDKLQAELGGSTFAVVAISVDLDGIKAVRPFFEELGLKNLSIYLDPQNITVTAFRAYGLPVSYIIDHKGFVMGYIIGGSDWSSAEARSMLNYYIGRIVN